MRVTTVAESTKPVMSMSILMTPIPRDAVLAGVTLGQIGRQHYGTTVHRQNTDVYLSAVLLASDAH